MERSFLASMGINPNIMKEPLQYLNENAKQSTRNKNTSEDTHRTSLSREDTHRTSLSREDNINDTDIPEDKIKVSISDPSVIEYERFLRSIGIDISKLSIQQINQINSVGDPTKLSPEETRNFFRSLGVDIKKVGQVIEKRSKDGNDSSNSNGGVDICVKVGRNDKCPCGSNKKFKKCCE